ncbi:M23 family metallopeptidase [Kitasatospora sp. NPDC049258]|uniref:M23 family metallopeptidase n=1 Tax=Kitasatospora sp. NPDC049258 TaxID=3155394 RepID=UPI0034387A58
MTLNSRTGERTGARTGTRVRQRELARRGTRTAVLTVALPSAATLGVFSAAAVAVQHEGGHPPAWSAADGTPTAARSAPAAPAPAADPARADRTGSRPGLPEPAQPAAPQQAPAERPHHVLPVDAHGLSAGFGQAGDHWAVRHTGIDFPVPAGTPVRAATDGTVTTRWSPAYGYLATVTDRDGTSTWYAHLRSYRIRKGPVRAGDVIAYSGNSGNSTGPHLHFEVRPDGAVPVDPLPWLLAHGLDPR